MAHTVLYFEHGAPCTDPVMRKAVAHDFRNSRGDKAVILHRAGKFEVHSDFYMCSGFNSLKAAAKALVDRSPIGRCDWEEVA